MNTWKPTTAGVLEIIAGSFHFVTGFVVILIAGGVAGGLRLAELPQLWLFVPLPLIAGIGLPFLVLGTISLLGGISALQRKRWGLALARCNMRAAAHTNTTWHTGNRFRRDFAG